MEMTQPYDEIKLPNDIQRAIEQGRNQVTILSAECDRLNGLINSYNYSVGQLHNQQRDYEERLPETRREFEKISSELNDAQDAKSKAIKELNDLEDSIQVLKNKMNTEMAEMESKRKQFAEERMALDEIRNAIEKHCTDISERERSISAKEDKLRELLN